MIEFNLMNQEIRLFVGAWDSGELAELAAQTVREGGYVVFSDNDIRKKLDEQPTRNVTVVAEGGLATDCIPKLIDLVLTVGVPEVKVPLERIRFNADLDRGSGEAFDWEFRQTLIQEKLAEKGYSADDPRIIFLRPAGQEG